MSDTNKVTGNITAINAPESISGGKYNKMTFVVSNKDGYEGADKNYAFEIFEKAEGERITNFNKFNKVGQNVEVSFDIRCNENNGKWFTSLSAFKVWANKETAQEAAQEAAPVANFSGQFAPF
jgi:hypothetical protein